MAVVNDGVATTLVFGCWTLHGDGRLTAEGVDIQLPPKECQILRLLLVAGGALMTKDRLLEQGWPQGDVCEESLTRCIYALRKHLKADNGFIKTVYGKGYRFTCPVSIGRPARQLTGQERGEHICPACGQVSHG